MRAIFRAEGWWWNFLLKKIFLDVGFYVIFSNFLLLRRQWKIKTKIWKGEKLRIENLGERKEGFWKLFGGGRSGWDFDRGLIRYLNENFGIIFVGMRLSLIYNV